MGDEYEKGYSLMQYALQSHYHLGYKWFSLWIRMQISTAWKHPGLVTSRG